MGLGVITGALCIVRTVLNYQTVTNDPTWDVIPNWYWRAWEVFFGLVAACIPTLRPGYKWLIKYIVTKIGHASEQQDMQKVLDDPATQGNWVPPKPSARFTKRHTLDISTTGMSTTDTGQDDHTVLQELGTSVKPQHPIAEEDAPWDGSQTHRAQALHIPGDLSTHRPGHFKRLDSEGRVGGGSGAEEARERI